MATGEDIVEPTMNNLFAEIMSGTAQEYAEKYLSLLKLEKPAWTEDVFIACAMAGSSRRATRVTVQRAMRILLTMYVTSKFSQGTCVSTCPITLATTCYPRSEDPSREPKA